MFETTTQYIIVVPNLPNQTWKVMNLSALSEKINRGNIMTLETGYVVR